MAALLGVSLVLVVLYSLAAAVVPALRTRDRRRDVGVVHAIMGVGMATMLFTTTQGRAWPLLGLGVFVVALCWSLGRLVGTPARAVYARLAVGCAAMTAMLAPKAAAAVAGPGNGSAVAAHAGHPGQHDPGGGAVGAGGLPPTLPPVLVAVLLVALGVVVLGRLLPVVRGRSAVRSRLDAACEAVMAAAMAYMLVVMA